MPFQEYVGRDRFAGRVAIVTGAGSGIGREVALRLAREGAAVSCPDINLDAAVESAALIARLDGKSLAVRMDITNSEDIKKMVRSTVEAFGKVDILVNSAGITTREPLLEISEEAWNREIAIDLTGTAFCIKHVVLEMKKAGGGRIVNLSSVAALLGAVAPAYSAAKGGIISLTRVLAGELAPHRINVNAICPGFVATPINEKLRQTGMEKVIRERIPWGRWGTPADIAALIAFLVSDEADYITGAVFQIDGGQGSYVSLTPSYFTADKA